MKSASTTEPLHCESKRAEEIAPSEARAVSGGTGEASGPTDTNDPLVDTLADVLGKLTKNL